MGLGVAAVRRIQLGERKGGAQDEAARLLPLRNRDRRTEGVFGSSAVSGIAREQDVAARAVALGVIPMLAGLPRLGERGVDTGERRLDFARVRLHLRQQSEA